jgi:allantoin racemase
MSLVQQDVALCRIALINPNTSTQATDLMLVSARQGLPAHVRVEGRTVRQGPALITHPKALAEASRIVADYGVEVAAEGFDALIISGFGDPGLHALRDSVKIPVFGIAQASITEAAQGGRHYSIVTVTPDLYPSLLQAAKTHGLNGTLASIRFTDGRLLDVMKTPEQLEAALLLACEKAVTTDGAQAIVIGGGPLAQAARSIGKSLYIPVIDPVSSAVRLAIKTLSKSGVSKT